MKFTDMKNCYTPEQTREIRAEWNSLQNQIWRDECRKIIAYCIAPDMEKAAHQMLEEVFQKSEGKS
ncbi:hypothetical protein LT85_0991 [Collimonas arenae]|uniref:Uncharacterized protein n=1 Tax=Collimonas arenae TaxID=279058 RepID=A0A0A1F8Z1_9BURK|nr:hypothetical protein [Collimonas arenae]AIY40149.1 hypothetical protein LT85_0991 [Collimonas arenae]